MHTQSLTTLIMSREIVSKQPQYLILFGIQLENNAKLLISV